MGRKEVVSCPNHPRRQDGKEGKDLADCEEEQKRGGCPNGEGGIQFASSIRAGRQKVVHGGGFGAIFGGDVASKRGGGIISPD